MRQIHNQPFSPVELAGFRDLMYQNILQAFGLILDCMAEWGLKVEVDNRVSPSPPICTSRTHDQGTDQGTRTPRSRALVQAAAKTVHQASQAFRSNHDLTAFPVELKQPVLDLWQDEGVQAACRRGKERCFPEK
jgi:hypothetical protein